ncbi:TatD family deoxyribonuclease [Dyella sp. M7H15-1]|uniref:TatD family hydrolase n=1 Tax=Dyella sp. M7H15-1 TaxID=2501295 RepID=UPI0010050750|nr:TatD family hydrolase [Dyella sp. M7H15-1]QAU23927.1 TatD family deoxyribonuclease [Dyella sp. M7H15-1]
MPRLADSHVHLDDARFDTDRDAAIKRACSAGVTVQVIPSTRAASWPRIHALCTPGSGLFPAYGMHPMFMHQHQPGDVAELSHWLGTRHPVAVGEIGLDFYQEAHDAQGQRELLRQQLALAREFDLPVILHARAALEEVTTTLRRTGGLRGVVHSFSGSLEQAEQLWKIGFHLGIGGPITYERAQRLRQIVASMPIEYLLLESDAPDQPGIMHRGERNEPSYLTDVLYCIAELRNQDPEALAATTTNNTMRLFGISVEVSHA